MIPSTGPNLAREPFANARPVRRLSALLWLLALALGAWNIHAYYASGAGASARRAELERLRTENAESRLRIDTLEGDLRRVDLERVNLQTEYLNQRIAERAFSWNLLFDDLVAVMPRQVRVQRLAPEGFRDDRATRAGRAPLSAERRVSLRISGEAGDDESLLEFVDRLFAHPAFDAPNLASESRNRTGGLDFELTVGYRPAGSGLGGDDAMAAPAGAAPAPAAPATVAAAAGGEAAPAGVVPRRPPVGEAAGGTEAPAGATAVTARPESTGVAAAARPAAARGLETSTAPTDWTAEDEATAPSAAPAAGREVPAPTPALSIFGVPLGAKPYASGGLP